MEINFWEPYSPPSLEFVTWDITFHTTFSQNISLTFFLKLSLYFLASVSCSSSFSLYVRTPLELSIFLFYFGSTFLSLPLCYLISTFSFHFYSLLSPSFLFLYFSRYISLLFRVVVYFAFSTFSLSFSHFLCPLSFSTSPHKCSLQNLHAEKNCNYPTRRLTKH